MKAWVLHGIGDIRLETAGEPEPAEGEVLVKVKAAGICGSDIPRIYKTGAYSYPLIPGHEFSGVVTAAGGRVKGQNPAGPAAPAGAKDISGIDGPEGWLGQRVGVFPLIPCGKCMPCRKKQYEMCRNYSYLGSRRDGGFAEYVAVPSKNLIRLPEGVSFEAAAMLEPMAVAVHAMRGMMPAPSDRVVVCGLGTVGLLLVMFLREAGMDKILVIGNKDFQKQMVLKMGVGEDSYCDSRDTDVRKWVAGHTDGMGADVFFECVGKKETYSLGVELAAPSGRICLVGNPGSDMELEKQVYWKILRNQLVVKGTWNSSFTHEAGDDWHYVMERISGNRVVPEKLISHRLGFEELEKGLCVMRDKTEDYVKVMGFF